MLIGFIGAGKVGCALGKYFHTKGLKVQGYYSRHYEDALQASQFTDSECYSSLQSLADHCDALFLTVNDDQIATVVEQLKVLKITNHILIHTSGCKSSQVFGTLTKTNACYSLHPIYAFANAFADEQNLQKCSFTIEGSESRMTEIIALITNLGNRIEQIETQDKIKYHAACVLMSNFVTAILAQAEALLNEIGMNQMDMFAPLIEDNIKNVLQYGAKSAITGPCMRGDMSTLKSHISELSVENRRLYAELSKVICQMKEEYQRKNILEYLEAIINESNQTNIS